MVCAFTIASPMNLVLRKPPTVLAQPKNSSTSLRFSNLPRSRYAVSYPHQWRYRCSFAPRAPSRLVHGQDKLGHVIILVRSQGRTPFDRALHNHRGRFPLRCASDQCSFQVRRQTSTATIRSHTESLRLQANLLPSSKVSFAKTGIITD